MLYFTNQLGYHNNYMINVDHVAYVLDQHDYISIHLLDITGKIHTVKYSVPYDKSMTIEQFETLVLELRGVFHSDRVDDAKIEKTICKVVKTFDEPDE